MMVMEQVIRFACSFFVYTAPKGREPVLKKGRALSDRKNGKNQKIIRK